MAEAAAESAAEAQAGAGDAPGKPASRLSEITKAVTALTALIGALAGLFIAFSGIFGPDDDDKSRNNQNSAVAAQPIPPDPASPPPVSAPERPGTGPVGSSPADSGRTTPDAPRGRGLSTPRATRFPDGRIVVEGNFRINPDGTITTVTCEAPNYLNAIGVCSAGAPPDIVCPPGTRLNSATNQCEAVFEPPRYRDCPDGSRVSQGQNCPVAIIPSTIVYFGWDEDALTDRARQTLDGVIANYRTGGSPAVVLAAHADSSGAASYNVGLSQRRANRVRDYLAAGGIGAGSLTTQAFGETRPAVDTADGVREPDNRRVEITFGPGGW